MRLSTLYQPYTDDNPVCQDIRCLATVVSLVLRFANELGLNRLRTRDLLRVVETLKVVFPLRRALARDVGLGVTLGELLPVRETARDTSVVTKP